MTCRAQVNEGCIYEMGGQPTTWFHELWSSNKPFVQFSQRIGASGIECLQRMNFVLCSLFVEVLKHLSVFTDALSGVKHVTVSSLPPSQPFVDKSSC